MGKENVQIQMEFHTVAQKMTFLGKCIMLNETNQTGKTKNWVLSFLCRN